MLIGQEGGYQLCDVRTLKCRYLRGVIHSKVRNEVVVFEQLQ